MKKNKPTRMHQFGSWKDMLNFLISGAKEPEYIDLTVPIEDIPHPVSDETID